MCVETYSMNSNLDDSIVSLSAFPSRISVKLHNIPVTPKLVDFSKTYDLVFFPVVFLKKNETELSYILSELFNMCLKEPCFPGCWKF